MALSSESSTLCRSCMTRLHGKEPMDHDNVEHKLFYVYSTSQLRTPRRRPSIFVATPVSTKKTRVMALQKLDIRDPPYTDKNIIPVISDELNHEPVFVTVKSRVYSIGGLVDKTNPTNEVRVFDTNKLEFELESGPRMILLRWKPAVVSLSGIIYVFGGENCKGFPWAEFLDTNVPKEEQVWKALKEPLFRIEHKLYATAYDARTILIGGATSKDAILYNVDDGSSMRYDFASRYQLYMAIENPVNVGDKTIYWTNNMNKELLVYDLEKHTCCRGQLGSVLHKYALKEYTRQGGPVLVHLNDNLFCCFTLYSPSGEENSYSTRIGIVECTRFLVNKDDFGNLKLELVGYESYRCDPISESELSGAVSIEGSLGGLNKLRT